MTYTEAVQDFITAINYDRFSQIETAHAPGAIFHSFRGPILQSSVAIEQWHREFLRNYADCTYQDPGYIEQDNAVAVHATIEAKGYDFRRFHQQVLDIYELTEDEFIAARRLYAMLRDIELEKQVASVHSYAVETKGGSASSTRDVVGRFYDALLAGDADAVAEHLYEKCAIIDSIYGIAAGPDAIVEIFNAAPRPPFGIPRVTSIIAGDNAAAVEVAIDASRPRSAHLVRVVEGKVSVVEVYWMLREIGFNPFEEYRQDRHHRRAILPI
jgi:hypothetical protein